MPNAFKLNRSLCFDISVQTSNSKFINPGKLGGDLSPNLALLVKVEQQALLSH